MKKIQKISLAGISFSLDDDAYQSLANYLEALHKLYGKSTDGAEIISDIEARIAELILSDQMYSKIVSKDKIDAIITQLGMPESDENGDVKPAEPTTDSVEAQIPRRLYRSRDGRVLGGVFSGMGKYWDIDAVWLRLGYCVPLLLLILSSILSWGWFEDFCGSLCASLFVLYVLLWIIIPVARTPRQYLEMRGEKITAQSIHKGFQKETPNTPKARKSASVWAEVLTVVGRILLFCIRFVAAACGIVLLIWSLALFVGMFVVLLAPSTVMLWAAPLGALFAGAVSVGVILIALILLIVIVPCAFLSYILLTFAFDGKMRPAVMWSMFLLWIVLLLGFGITTACNVPKLKAAYDKFELYEDIMDAENLDDTQRMKQLIEQLGYDGMVNVGEVTITRDTVTEGGDVSVNVNTRVSGYDKQGRKTVISWSQDGEGTSSSINIMSADDSSSVAKKALVKLGKNHIEISRDVNSDNDSIPADKR